MSDHDAKNLPLNCWEFMKCGREPGGTKVNELGVCPAATDTSCDGLNNGKNGGRICWAIAGTFCLDRGLSRQPDRIDSCAVCEFFKKVREEENLLKLILLRP